ncbi:hypothetical protein CAPTEDRAFT_146804 [Capitella teleta]|uniref:Fork-head domain-containing protein n=1 Tax=Capitella teleta TaxID=283909 RepID=R7TC58_CAPTE|nr:hypothetical protein CAPTEDRAFT_146804 [Capitella teleta]|eukprot:ELT89077.1 hypothetical protein CAPTEDRAFT_146804 [Capitella teleta]
MSEYPGTVNTTPLKQAVPQHPKIPGQSAALPKGQPQPNPVAGGSGVAPDTLPAYGSYGVHIGRAFMESEDKLLHVHYIYEYFLKKFSGLKFSESNWKGSIRNKLTTSECFQKSQSHAKVNGRKGVLWFVRENYLEEFRKRNFHATARKKKPLTKRTKKKP